MFLFGFILGLVGGGALVAFWINNRYSLKKKLKDKVNEL